MKEKWIRYCQRNLTTFQWVLLFLFEEPIKKGRHIFLSISNGLKNQPIWVKKSTTICLIFLPWFWRSACCRMQSVIFYSLPPKFSLIIIYVTLVAIPLKIYVCFCNCHHLLHLLWKECVLQKVHLGSFQLCNCSHAKIRLKQIPQIHKIVL